MSLRRRWQRGRSAAGALALACGLGFAPVPAVAAGAAIGAPVDLLAGAAWEPAPADGVAMEIAREATGPGGRPALRVDYDFGGHGGWAALRRPLAVELPESYELRFRLKGEGPPNRLEVKLVDPSGANVWWHVRPDDPWPADWARVRIKKRQIDFAWGPDPDAPLTRTGTVELAITAGRGGRGTVWIADFELVPTEPAAPPAGPPIATAGSAAAGHPPGHRAELAIDGDRATAWRPEPGRDAALTVDLRGLVELGGVSLVWEDGREPRRFRVEASEDGATWELVRAVDSAGAAQTALRMPDAEARALRVSVAAADCPAAGCGLAELAVRPPAFGATLDDFVTALAAEAPRGDYPRGFGEAVYWTVVGLDGADPEALVSEDGAVELWEAGASLEPFVTLDGRLATWADATTGLSLAEGDLPLPTVAWTLPGARLEIEPLVTGDRESSVLLVRYRLVNQGREPRRAGLTLAARPLQVDPPYQFLNLDGGTARVERVACVPRGLAVGEPPGGIGGDEPGRVTDEIPGGSRGEVSTGPAAAEPAIGLGGVEPGSGAVAAEPASWLGGAVVEVWPAPARCGTSDFDQGPLVEALRRGRPPAAAASTDPEGLASGILQWEAELGPGEALEVLARTRLVSPGIPAASPAADPAAADPAAANQPTGDPPPSTHPAPDDAPIPHRAARDPAAPALAASDGAAPGAATAGSAAPDFDLVARAERDRWRALLAHPVLDLPPEAAPLVATLRSSLAWILIHRDGAAIQPGSRAYARSWIRDGALTAEALLRLGLDDPARDFADWFAGFQYPDGKVPCCVDRSGAGPVPEHDSHGELIHLIREVHRYTGDRGFAERLFPHVASAAGYIDALRRQRLTPEYAAGERAIFHGLLPESISHEGYSARPVHSYWDDAWAYRGLADAAELAAALGRPEEAARWAGWRDALRDDLLASIALVRRRRGLDYVPGSADLGDFDSTATTVMLDPCGLGPDLPAATVEATFERYWRQFVGRAEPASDWTAYVPYEIRHVGTFVRLGWIDRAHRLLAGFLADRRPPAWNGWPEVVHRDPRAPLFLGDLPHGWVASDFIRSVLDLVVYEDRERRALVLAAGVPAGWLDRPEGIGVGGIGTPWGRLSYRLERRGDGVRYTLAPDPLRPLVPPPGGLVLTWPLAGRPGAVLIDGVPLPPSAEAGGAVSGRVTVPIRRLPAVVDLLPADHEGDSTNR